MSSFTTDDSSEDDQQGFHSLVIRWNPINMASHYVLNHKDNVATNYIVEMSTRAAVGAAVSAAIFAIEKHFRDPHLVTVDTRKSEIIPRHS